MKIVSQILVLVGYAFLAGIMVSFLLACFALSFG